MHRKSLLLLALFLGIAGWLVWLRGPLVPGFAQAGTRSHLRISPQATPGHARVSRTSPLRSPLTPTLMPTPTLAPTLTSTPSPAMQRYAGDAPVTSIPDFEIWYDAAQWELTEGHFGMHNLVHRTIDRCKLELVTGETDAQLIASTTLAGYTWDVLQIDAHTFIYRTSHYNWRNGFYSFKVTYPDALPASHLFHEVEHSECRQLVEGTISNFAALDAAWYRAIPAVTAPAPRE